MSLNDWLKNGWLKPHQPVAREIADLLALAARDLKDCNAKGLSDDWKFNIAYNAALQSASAALAASGYAVPKGESNHFRVIQSLAHTVSIGAASLAKLDTYRKKRSMSIYDAAGVITASESSDMVKVAIDLTATVTRWLDEEHPELRRT
jgi:hypothetical protein